MDPAPAEKRLRLVHRGCAGAIRVRRRGQPTGSEHVQVLPNGSRARRSGRLRFVKRHTRKEGSLKWPTTAKTPCAPSAVLPHSGIRSIHIAAKSEETYVTVRRSLRHGLR